LSGIDRPPEKTVSQEKHLFHKMRTLKDDGAFLPHLSGRGKIFTFAGRWDRWRGPDGQSVESCTILTTTRNELLADVHDRMPVILAPEHQDKWLDPGMQDAAAAVALLKPFDSNLRGFTPLWKLF
jgi:putative SOS response-associated peptidase YedK